MALKLRTETEMILIEKKMSRAERMVMLTTGMLTVKKVLRIEMISSEKRGLRTVMTETGGRMTSSG